MEKKNTTKLLYFVFLFVILLAKNSLAGNLNLIEDRLKELDELNKRTVKEAVNLPQSGVVYSTVDIAPGKGGERLTVKEKKVEKKDKTLKNRPYTIQINSSNNRERILEIANKLNDNGIPAYVSTPFHHQGKQWWRLFIGWYATYEQAEKANEALYENKFPQGYITKLPFAIKIGERLNEIDSSKVYNKLISQGYMPYKIKGADGKKSIILLGAYKTEKEAEATLVGLTDVGYEKFVITR